MKKIKRTYIGLFLLLTVLWLIADPLMPGGFEFFAFRKTAINYTGIIAIGVMSVSMVLAMRPVWLESMLGGLDKAYRLHKWLGITGLVLAIVHWLWIQGPKWAVGWGWLVKPPKGPREVPIDPVLLFFQQQKKLAETIGEWAFYAVVVLIVLALIKRFPYRLFFKSHRLLPIAYLFLVFHSVVLMPFAYWQQAEGVVMGVLMAAGTVSALLSLMRKVGSHRKVVGEIDALEYFQDSRVLKVVIRLAGRWPGHDAGQFAFLTFDPAEGAHPFTISSGWADDGRLTFMIKGIGDYTARLPSLLEPGGPVTVEGPYGRFAFASKKPRQIWVAGGIGITPFIARMRSLAIEPDGRPVDLFYCMAAPDDTFVGRLQKDAEAVNVNLHVILTPRDGYLDVEQISAAVPEWSDADFWFCGPAAFGQTLRKGFVEKGLSADDFHQELFDMR